MITLAIVVLVFVVWVICEALDRIEEAFNRRRDDKRYAARFRAKSSLVGAGRDGEK